MIISLRGTSGSGKSHIARTVTGLYDQHRSVFAEGRQKPLYDIHGRNPQGRCLVTPGHYLIANGGIDTLPSLDEAYRIARWAANQDHDVLMEGKNMSDGVSHVNKLLEEEFDVRVVVVNTDVPLCIKSVRERGHKIAERSIQKTFDKVMRDVPNFHCNVVVGDRQSCLEQICQWLNMGMRFNGQHRADEQEVSRQEGRNVRPDTH
jgi:ABC-type dipeptide/oligopeptide/nickel transport system ATPase component